MNFPNKNKNEQSEFRNNREYLNFIKKNHLIVEEFKELNRIKKLSENQSRKVSSTLNDYNDTIQSQRFEPINLNNPNNKIIRLHSKKDIPSINDLVLQADLKFNVPGEMSIHSRKQANMNLLYPHHNFQGSSKSMPKELKRQQNIEQNSLPKLPRIYHQSADDINQHSEVMEKDNISQKNREKSGKRSKYAPIQIDNTKKNLEVDTQANIKNMKFMDVQTTIKDDKLIRTYYDYENYMALKNKVSELIPSFKPIQSKKKQKYQILQLNSEFDSQLDKFLQTSKAKKFYKKPPEKQSLKKEPEKIEQNKQQNKEHKSQKIKRKPPVKVQIKKKQPIMVFRSHGPQNTIYLQKIKSYREFIFLVNFAHRIYDPLILSDDHEKYKVQNKYKFYIGKGNNSLLIKSLMKRRFWWTQVDDPRQANFVWTQLKINSFYQFQRKSYLQNKFDKIDEDFQYKEPKPFKKNNSLKKLQIKDGQPKLSGILRGNLPEGQKKIFTKADKYYLKKIHQNLENTEKLQKFENRLKYLPENFLLPREQTGMQSHVHNHFLQNYHIGNKKALFYNLKRYYDLIGKDVFTIIPLTFHIKTGTSDPEYQNFVREFKFLKNKLNLAEKKKQSTKKLSKNVWIVKPGELSNRGNGITVFDQLYEINTILKSKQKHTNGLTKTYIIQKYIEKPLLYKGRKFDIRHFMMISRMHGRLRAYWFSEGYIRTSSVEYSLDQIGDEFMHLTNDAIQKQGPRYGRFEEGNKISYAEFQRYIDNNYPQKKYSFIEHTYEKMKEIATDSIKATYLDMDPDESQHNFEIFGLDFMIDSHFNVWLIEVNTNPCLEINSNLLSRVIPGFIENTLRMTIDPIFPPTAHYLNTIKYLTPDTPMERLQFELIFDEGRDGKQIQTLFMNSSKTNCGQIDEDDETYENDGNELDLGGDID